MAREYPRFLYSNPKDTKAKGPFIVHTLFPKALFKFIPCNSEEYSTENLNKYLFHYCSYPGGLVMIQDDPNCDAAYKEKLCKDAWKWLMHHAEFQLFMKERKIIL